MRIDQSDKLPGMPEQKSEPRGSDRMRNRPVHSDVIPAKAGIHSPVYPLSPALRRAENPLDEHPGQIAGVPRTGKTERSFARASLSVSFFRLRGKRHGQANSPKSPRIRLSVALSLGNRFIDRTFRGNDGGGRL